MICQDVQYSIPVMTTPPVQHDQDARGVIDYKQCPNPVTIGLCKMLNIRYRCDDCSGECVMGETHGTH